MGGRCKYLIGRSVGRSVGTNQHLQHFVFPYLNLCVVLNIHPTIPDILRSIIGKFARLQTGNINAEQFHDEFFANCSPNDPELRSTHRVVANYPHDWWKDRFDTLGFPLPFIDINEVMEMTHDHFDQLVSDGYLALHVY